MQPGLGQRLEQFASPPSTFRRQVALEPLRKQNQESMLPALRASPFPEVTDLFCRLPLSTLFYRPEADHLGDLMRLWVRAGVK